ncbi:hypothetical protein LZG04_02025 [Saccharothrix sp. S26]|uniref:hypothetical protein n=1 Tax=Saccharothrix sp. S26 TaxID=2907215 RepID=UPI001F1CFDAF|nr:hypothetical protein [Saccharothrix sp. S26]MCE6993589.1 hypothetical protein [Saccharothrix sp. S26]
MAEPRWDGSLSGDPAQAERSIDDWVEGMRSRADRLQALRDQVGRIRVRVGGGTVMARFDPDPDMAKAWLRLRSSRAQPLDIALLEHELAAARYWRQNPNASYREARAAANDVSRWETQIPPASNEDYSEPWR